MRKSARDISLIKELKEKVATASRILCHELEFVEYSGHASARVPNTDRILIKARHTEKVGYMLTISAKEVVMVDLEGNLIEGSHEPPSETSLHTEIYKMRKDVGGIVHTHQKFALAFGIAGREILPVFHPVAASSVSGGIPIYKSAELINIAEQGKAVAETLGDRHACHLQGHGIVVVGKSVEEATIRATYLEQQAELNYMALQLGSIKAIPSDVIRESRGIESRWRYLSSLVPLKK